MAYATYLGIQFGYVYFIQAGSVGPIKIGSATNPKDRLKTLQTGCPEELHIVGVIPSYDFRGQEQEIQQKFLRLRENGEWFRSEKDLLVYIKTHSRSWDDNKYRGLTPEAFREKVYWENGYNYGVKAIVKKAKKLMQFYNIPLTELAEILEVSYEEASDA